MNEETNDQIEQRRANIQALEEAGREPFPHAWTPTHVTSEVIRAYEEQHGEAREPEPPVRVSIAGRMTARRVMGKASFFDLSDERGRLQVYLARDAIGASFYNEVFRHALDLGDFLGVEGEVFRTRTGEITVRADSVRLLAKSVRPLPVVKSSEGEVFHDVSDPEFRYRQRYVDLAIHPEVRDTFRQRSQIIAALRGFLDARGYLEVETPILQPLYGGAAARPFTTWHNKLGMEMFLRIAPELYLKRLIVGGFEGVYELGKDFRNEGISRLHNPEFTMLELYVAYRDADWMMGLVEEMITTMAQRNSGSSTRHWRGHEISLEGPWPRRPFYELLDERLGDRAPVRDMDRATLETLLDELGLEVEPGEEDVAGMLDALFASLVEPTLIQPTFVTDYPVASSPLARQQTEDPGLAERFELFVGGCELCNAFSELNDPREQRRRFEAQARERTPEGEEVVIDEDYIRALEYGMPPTAGLGIGIDRLVMLLTEQDSIRDVVLFPLLRQL